LLLYRVGDCVMHLCPICNRRTRNFLDDDDDDDDDDDLLKTFKATNGPLCRPTDVPLRNYSISQ